MAGLSRAFFQPHASSSMAARCTASSSAERARFARRWSFYICRVLWGRLATCGRLVIGQALDHGNSSGAIAKPAVTGLSSMLVRHAHELRLVPYQPVIALVLPK